MTYLAAVLSVACFAGALRFLGMAKAAGRVVAVAREASAHLHDPVLTDLEKEQRARRASWLLLTGFVSIVARGVVASGVAALAPLAFEAAGFSSLSMVVRLLTTWPGLALGIVVTTPALIVRTRYES